MDNIHDSNVVVKIQNIRTGSPKRFTIKEDIKLGKRTTVFRNVHSISQSIAEDTCRDIPSKIARYLGYARAKEWTAMSIPTSFKRSEDSCFDRKGNGDRIVFNEDILPYICYVSNQILK